MAEHLSRRGFLRSSVAAGAVLAGLQAGRGRTGGGDGRPNIILIMADDLGYECLSCYGCADYRTPHLDGLAAGGLRFTHCYSQPLCTPSRVKIMTGRYNCRNYRRFGALHPDETTFGHVLREAGYATCVAGKWQLAARGGGEGTYPVKAGFDDYCLWQIDERQSRYADPLLQMKGDEESHVIEDAYGPDVFCDYVNRFIERHRRRPFFVYFPMCLVHAPFVPTPDSPEWRENRNRRDTKFFKDMVEYMDGIVGRIGAKLDELGLRENTLLMFTGDNGTHRRIKTRMEDGRAIQGGKGRTTDAGTRVPLVASWPAAAPRGRVLDDLIDFSDFFPTVAAAAGASLPDGLQIDGRSFLPQLQGREGRPREWTYCYYKLKGGGGKVREFVRDRRWKLYASGEFYDVKADPLEENPIPGGQAGPAAAAARRKLRTALKSVR